MGVVHNFAAKYSTGFRISHTILKSGQYLAVSKCNGNRRLGGGVELVATCTKHVVETTGKNIFYCHIHFPKGFMIDLIVFDHLIILRRMIPYYIYI